MKITHHDNRGTAKDPFGFVYFDDGVRVGYTPRLEAQVWPFEGPYWTPATSEHVRLATEYLVEYGIAIGQNKVESQQR